MLYLSGRKIAIIYKQNICHGSDWQASLKLIRVVCLFSCFAERSRNDTFFYHTTNSQRVNSERWPCNKQVKSDSKASRNKSAVAVWPNGIDSSLASIFIADDCNCCIAFQTRLYRFSLHFLSKVTVLRDFHHILHSALNDKRISFSSTAESRSLSKMLVYSRN